MTEGNLYFRPDGQRECLTCKKNRNRKKHGSVDQLAEHSTARRSCSDKHACSSPDRSAKIEKFYVDEAVDRVNTMSPIESLISSGLIRPSSEVPMCPHTEYDTDTGETYGCCLTEGHKGKCKRGERQ